MSRLIRFGAAFLEAEDGPTAVEYAVMLCLIVVVCLASIMALGQNANQTFGAVSDSLNSLSGAPSSSSPATSISGS
jgi:pilus assembly protein Flp/PilA